ncbi:MAG: hypothetical protein ACXVLT_05505 [Flavisolibacter sp.]
MKRNFLLSFLLLVVAAAMMWWRGGDLITPQSPRGIIDFEFARTTEHFRQLQFFWSHETVLQNIYLYFLLVIAYTWFLVATCKILANNRSNLFSAIAISAGAFNLLENFVMTLVWNQRFNPSLLQMVFYAAVIKFALIVLVIGFIILSLFGLFRQEP